MAIGQWRNRRAGSLLLLASVVAVVAVFYGNTYASDGHGEEEQAGHAEEEAAAEGHEEEAGHAEQAGGKEGSRALKIGGGILISTVGVGLIPLGLLLVRRPPRREDEFAPVREVEAPVVAPPEPTAGVDLEPLLRPALALLSAGTAVIHFVVIPGHWAEYWAQGLFFIGAAVAQLLWALWIVIAPSRLIYLAGAAGNAAIVAMWVVTRTAGVPAGPGAGEREAVEFADTLATAFEVVLVLGALALARLLPARRIERESSGLAASTVAIAVAALTTTALLSLAELW